MYSNNVMFRDIDIKIRITFLIYTKRLTIAKVIRKNTVL